MSTPVLDTISNAITAVHPKAITSRRWEGGGFVVNDRWWVGSRMDFEKPHTGIRIQDRWGKNPGKEFANPDEACAWILAIIAMGI